MRAGSSRTQRSRQRNSLSSRLSRRLTNARDVYTAVVIGGPGLVWGVGALPSVIVPPIIDDFGRINRVSWYGIFDYHLLRDVYTEVWLSAASI